MFDKINSNKLIEILKELMDEDELVAIKYHQNSPSETTNAEEIGII